MAFHLSVPEASELARILRKYNIIILLELSEDQAINII